MNDREKNEAWLEKTIKSYSTSSGDILYTDNGRIYIRIIGFDGPINITDIMGLGSIMFDIAKLLTYHHSYTRGDMKGLSPSNVKKLVDLPLSLGNYSVFDAKKLSSKLIEEASKADLNKHEFVLVLIRAAQIKFML